MNYMAVYVIQNQYKKSISHCANIVKAYLQNTDNYKTPAKYEIEMSLTVVIEPMIRICHVLEKRPAILFVQR